LRGDYQPIKAMLHASGFDQQHAYNVQRLMWRVLLAALIEAVLESTHT